ncbi:hypothetical protein H7I76_15360, partial [Mycolicibacterium vaccae]|nr:hypothetical protein [Mycolicibacterium vaccae]
STKPERAPPAGAGRRKNSISVRELAREILTESLSGGLDAIGQRAQGMYSGLPQGMGFGGQIPQLGRLGSYGPMMSNYLVDSPQDVARFFDMCSSR